MLQAVPGGGCVSPPRRPAGPANVGAGGGLRQLPETPGWRLREAQVLASADKRKDDRPCPGPHPRGRPTAQTPVC